MEPGEGFHRPRGRALPVPGEGATVDAGAQGGRCCVRAVKGKGGMDGGGSIRSKRRGLWRQSGLDYGPQNETDFLQHGCLRELVRDPIFRPYPHPSGVGPSHLWFGKPPGGSEGCRRGRSTGLDD